VTLAPQRAEMHNNLGNALAARGQSDEAIAHYRKAMNLAVQQGRQPLAELLRRKLAMYESGKPIR